MIKFLDDIERKFWSKVFFKCVYHTGSWKAAEMADKALECFRERFPQ